MDFSEYIGLFITLAAIFTMFVKKSRASRERVEHGEHGEHGDTLNDFLKSLEGDMESSKDFKKEKPSPAPVVAKKEVYKPMPRGKTMADGYSFKTDIDVHEKHNPIQDRKLNLNIKEKNYGGDLHQKLVGYKRPSRIQRLIHSMPSKSDIVLLHEILSPPKGL